MHAVVVVLLLFLRFVHACLSTYVHTYIIFFSSSLEKQIDRQAALIISFLAVSMPLDERGSIGKVMTSQNFRVNLRNKANR